MIFLPFNVEHSSEQRDKTVRKKKLLIYLFRNFIVCYT